MEKTITTVPIADAEYTSSSRAVLRARNVGSCMAAAAMDPMNGVGGLLHVLLPDARIDPFSADSIAFNPYKYISTGIPLFLRHIFDMGATHDELRLLVFGGADLGGDDNEITIGYRNITALRHTLWGEGVLMHEQEFGGRAVRSLVQLDMEEQSVSVNHRKKGRTVYGS